MLKIDDTERWNHNDVLNATNICARTITQDYIDIITDSEHTSI